MCEIYSKCPELDWNLKGLDRHGTWSFSLIEEGHFYTWKMTIFTRWITFVTVCFALLYRVTSKKKRSSLKGKSLHLPPPTALAERCGAMLKHLIEDHVLAS